MEPQFNIVELKQNLLDFHEQIKEMIETDPEYDGEADNVLAAIERVQNELSTINSEEEFGERVPHFAEDLFFVLRCAQEFADEGIDDEEGEDFDLDEEGEEEDDEEDLAYQRLEFDVEISRYVNRKYLEMFKESAEFKALTKVQKDHAAHILDSFSSYINEYLQTDFHDLFVDDLEDLCFRIFPNQFYASEEVFKEVPAVLIALFKFLDDQALLEEAEDFVNFLEENKDKIIEMLSDSELWSSAKTFLMVAVQSEGGEFETQKLMDQAEEFWDQLEFDQID